jgi:hypothetical protein
MGAGRGEMASNTLTYIDFSTVLGVCKIFFLQNNAFYPCAIPQTVFCTHMLKYS